MKSLKTQLLTWVCGAATTVMVVAAVMLYLLARAYQIDQLDRHVQEKARLIVSMIELEGDSIELEFENLDLREFQTQQAGWYLQVWVDDQSIYQSPSYEDQTIQLPLSMAAVPQDMPGGDHTKSSRLAWVDLPGSSRGRAMVLAFGPDGEASILTHGSSGQGIGSSTIRGLPVPIHVFIACDAREVLTVLRSLAIGLVIVTSVAVFLLGVILITIVPRGLRPVDELAGMMKQIDAADLNTRMADTTLPRELEPIVSQFNALLTRLHAAFERERAFCADIAHELRTPLAGLRATLEVTQKRTRDPQQYATAIERCRGMVTQTQSLVDNLLQIARFETGQIQPTPRHVDLNALMHAIWENLFNENPVQKDYRLTWKLAEYNHLWTDPGVLEIVLRNLFDNAMYYVAPDGFIKIESSRTGRRVTIVIANSGCQVKPQDAAKVFNRFWRGSQSRTDTGSHFGLGLSLAHRAITTLGGTLHVDIQANGVFRATCMLPTTGSPE